MKRTDTPTLSGPLHAGDLINSLVWPRLLRAAGLALHPGRLGLAAGILVLIGIIASIPGLWLEAGTGPRVTAGDALGGAGAQIVSGVLALDHVSVAHGLWKFGVDAPTQVVNGHPWSVVIILIPVLLVWGVGGAAIARSAASEYSLREKTPWPTALGFGVSKAASLVGAKLTPLLIVAVVVGLRCVGGWVLLRFPLVQAFGGLAYVLALGGWSVKIAAVLLTMVLTRITATKTKVPAMNGANSSPNSRRSRSFIWRSRRAGKPGRRSRRRTLVGRWESRDARS